MLQVDGKHRWLDLSEAADGLLRIGVNGAAPKTLPWRRGWSITGLPETG